jgi:flagellar hook-associated protein 2
MPGMAVDGLVSGMSTGQVIDQIMQLEARGQLALMRRVKSHQLVQSAYQAVNAMMLGLHTAANALTKQDTWQAVKATSSSDAVTATASAGAVPGSVTFDVDALAKASTWSTTNSVALTADVLDGNPLVITKNGTDTTITPLDGSLSSVVSAINASNAGVSAAAVQVSPGEYLLQITSKTTGAGSIAVSGLDVATLGEASVAGADARVLLRVGTSTQAVTSATNTFSNMLPGLTFTVSKLEAGVTLDLRPDGAGIADKVEAMVAAANTALDQISKYASYDAQTKVRGPLMSDSTIRSLQQQVLSTVSTAINGAGVTKEAGIELTKDGRLTFTRATFLATFDTDPAKLQRLVGPSGTFTPAASGLQGSVTFSRSTDRTREGTYAIEITQAATRASAGLTLSAFQSGDVITVGNASGSVTAEYVVQSTDTLDDVITGINAAASAQKLSVAASADGSGGIRVDATVYGSGGTFTLAATGAVTASAVTAGKDVAGRIGNAAAIGSGQLLTVDPAVTGPETGLSVVVTLTEADLTTLGSAAVGSFDYVQGVGQRLSSLAKAATDTIDGTLTRAIKSRTDTIDNLQDRIAAWDVSLERRRAALQRQFASLEVSLGRMREQSNWLAGQLASLPTSYS